MQETNYCAHALDDLRKLGRVGGHISGPTATHMATLLRQSVKFRLPDYGRIFETKQGDTVGDIISKYCPVFRLPYPVVALEWPISDCDSLSTSHPLYKTADAMAYDATVIIACEEESAGKRYVNIYPMCRSTYKGVKVWTPLNFGGRLCITDLTFLNTVQSEDGALLGARNSAAIADVIGEVSTLVKFVAALSCSNSLAVDAPAPDAKLNAKRRQAGKTPFFSYKVLTITGNASPEGSGSVFHGSPRVHLRRGHIRRLPEKTVWVNACVVGDKSKGLVQKDYKMV